jgi:Fur family ferric uptake transcriptional regulator
MLRYIFMKQKRNTVAKQEIEKLLEHSAYALSHQQIQQELGSLCNRVTIYRVLERLVEEGRVHKILNHDGVISYAYCQQCESHIHHHSHLHFSCTQCKRVKCLNEQAVSFQLPEAFTLEETHFTVTGVCPECR